jgi:phage terminase large subunit
MTSKKDSIGPMPDVVKVDEGILSVNHGKAMIHTLHRGQQEVYLDDTRFQVVVAGRRFGKTTLSLLRLLQAATKKPRANVWYVAPTYGMAREIMWVKLKRAIPQEWIIGVHETLLKITLRNGSTISLKGADRPDTLRGVGLDYIVLDEFQDMRDAVWEAVLRPTLATTKGGALFIGTPKSYNHFYKLYEKGQKQRNRKHGRDWKSWQFPTIMSPFVPTAEIEQAKEDLDPRTFRQEFEATFETMSGRVYYPFDRKKHIGKYPFNPKLPIWIGQDFNIDPMSSCIIQPQENGEIWIVDELVLFNSNVTEVCDVLEQRYWRYLKQIEIYPDPAGNSRSHARGESALDIFRSRGFNRIYHRKKHPFVQDRVNAVNSKLYSATGAITLRINETCRNVIDGLEQVIYKEGSTEIDKSMNKEHVIDALGYVIEYRYPTRDYKMMGFNI